ncbi:YcaO-like family protein [Microbacterium sp. NPDC091676]|uniref:YcaO-like family protein n=1 Tax=Microbacterium sp. NPDC091676 TaxID=3364212 RepID=UPI0037FDB7AB
MEAIYQEICKELSLDADADLKLSRASSTQIVTFRGEEGTVWAPISADKRWGCITCIGASVLLLEQYYADFERPVVTDRDAASLILRMLERHAIPIAVTDIYGPQCWSVCFPVPDCPACRDSDRQLQDIMGAFRPLGHDNTTPEASDTGGVRAASATAFVAANRAAIGFAAIVTNPYNGGDEPHATLIEGLIRTSITPNECEVAGGKGRSLEQALASFIGEALERYFVADPVAIPSVLGPENDLVAAISPEIEFGYPALDDTTGITPYAPDLLLEWIAAEELTGGNSVLLPANLAFCPYEPRDARASRFSVTTTTGVASGANVEDATLQALLELIERDAFWYFARTGQGLAELPEEALHPHVHAAKAVSHGRFTFQELLNPFGIPVVHATYVTDDAWETRTARGIGAGENLEQASLRAFVECLQILHSLNLGVEVEDVDGDMRHIWYTGAARHLLPNFFQHSDQAAGPGEAYSGGKRRHSLRSILELFARSSTEVYQVVLVDSPSFAVVRVMAAGMCLTDATYFSNSKRFQVFASALPGAPTSPRISYAGPTFM